MNRLVKDIYIHICYGKNPEKLAIEIQRLGDGTARNRVWYYSFGIPENLRILQEDINKLDKL